MISIALPTYNGEKYIREQLDSIYNQTLVPDEVVVVDDCSTDNTVNILEEYSQRYGLKYFVNDSNIGYNKNFEKAIRLCAGDYIALSDQDDVWFPTKIQVSYDAISKFPKDRPALVSSFVEQVDANLKPVRHDFGPLQEGDWRLNLTRYNAQGCTLMMNKALLYYILPFPDDIIYDAYIGLTASMLGNRYYIPKKLMYYRLHGTNSLANIPKSQFAFKTKMYHLKAYMPFWYTKNEQYNYLKLVRKYQGQYFINDRIKTFEKVLKIFEVSKLRRLLIFISLDGPDLLQKLKTSVGLVFKMLFFMRDEY